MNEKTILAVNPGTKQIGVAVFADDELVYYGVKTTAKERPESGNKSVKPSATRIIERLIAKYQPDVFAIERLHRIYQQTPRLKVLYKSLIACAREQGLIVNEYSAMFIRRDLCGLDRPTRRGASRQLARHYPELDYYLAQSSQWQKQYYGIMFDAIAVGFISQGQLTRRSSAATKSINS